MPSTSQPGIAYGDRHLIFASHGLGNDKKRWNEIGEPGAFNQRGAALHSPFGKLGSLYMDAGFERMRCEDLERTLFALQTWDVSCPISDCWRN